MVLNDWLSVLLVILFIRLILLFVLAYDESGGNNKSKVSFS